MASDKSAGNTKKVIRDSAAGGGLYVVATPIGNLQDISARALEVLASVDVILAEDTRHSAKLLGHYGISTPCRSFHDHNESRQVARIAQRIADGDRIALISDAGTPLISDPGFRLVAALREQGYAVISIPGPCALVSALSVAGLATDRFCFEGFLPARTSARQQYLQSLARESRTLVFYESPRRILQALADLGGAFGGHRPAVVARELTKIHESVIAATRKSGLHRAGCQVTPGGREPTESATENIPPAGNGAVRVKWCGKSAPRRWQHRWQGKPHPEQDQIGELSAARMAPG